MFRVSTTYFVFREGLKGDEFLVVKEPLEEHQLSANTDLDLVLDDWDTFKSNIFLEFFNA